MIDDGEQGSALRVGAPRLGGMRALVLQSYGGREAMALTDVPAPTAGAGEVLIRTRAVGLNPVDAMHREGDFKAIAPDDFPTVAGNELSGIVETVGAGVTAFAPGDAVITRVDPSGHGAFAELAAVRADWVAAAPARMPLTDAAGLPLAGLTAQQALGPEHLDLQSGERLLITGAAGGVGLIATRLAHLRGAHVTVTASAAGEPYVREAGADAVIDYRARTVAEGGERFDKVFDLIGGDQMAELLGSIEPGGRLVTIAGPPSPGSLRETARPSRRPLAAVVSRVASAKVRRAAKKAGVTYEFFLMHPDGAGLAELVRLVDAGELAVTVDSRYPLADWEQAFERLESHHAKGKVLLEF